MKLSIISFGYAFWACISITGLIFTYLLLIEFIKLF